jgi:hypothetical protein
VRTANNLATSMCRLSYNLGASTSWNPQGLYRPVMGLLHLYLTAHSFVVCGVEALSVFVSSMQYTYVAVVTGTKEAADSMFEFFLY